MIEKPTVIVTSLGRTGTKFFYTLLGEVIPASTSLHEPDLFNFNVVTNRRAAEQIRFMLRQVHEAGVNNMIRKVFGGWCLIDLSDARMREELSYEEAVKQLLSQREEFVPNRNGSVYVEANIGYYGLIDVLEEVYAHHRVAYIVRDGREWVRSHMNWGEMYGKSKVRSLLAHTWPAAYEIKGDPYAAEWDSMSRFERLCWAWTRLNEYALEKIEENPNARVFHFECVFKSEDRYQYLQDMIRFLTATLPGVEPIASDSLAGWLDMQIHKSRTRFPSWREWTVEQKQSFETLCGPLMEELKYPLEQSE